MEYQTKHLSVVECIAFDANSTLGSVYGSAKDKALSYSPGFVSTIVGNVENICKPFVTFGQKTSMNLLLCADTGVRFVAPVLKMPTFARRHARGRVFWEHKQHAACVLSTCVQLAGRLGRLDLFDSFLPRCPRSLSVSSMATVHAMVATISAQVCLNQAPVARP